MHGNSKQPVNLEGAQQDPPSKFIYCFEVPKMLPSKFRAVVINVYKYWSPTKCCVLFSLWWVHDDLNIGWSHSAGQGVAEDDDDLSLWEQKPVQTSKIRVGCLRSSTWTQRNQAISYCTYFEWPPPWHFNRLISSQGRRLVATVVSFVVFALVFGSSGLALLL